MISSDKSKELFATVNLLNEKLHFKGAVDGNPPVSIDYTSPLGDDSGYTSLELFLLSLASCVGSAVVTIMRKMQKRVSACEIRAHGFRKQEHPTGFRKIDLIIFIETDDLSNTEKEKIIRLSEGICPVWSMVKDNVEVSIDFQT